MLPGGGCKCDGRGGGLTAALLCGIWCAAMLITASHHPPSLRIYHCLMIYPPSLHLIPLPSVLPLSVLFTLGEAATWSSSSSSSVVVGVISDCRLPPLLSVTIHHFKHFSPSLHPSLALSAFICCCFFLFNGEEEVICGRDGADVGFDVDCSIPPSPSVTVYHFSPSALFLRPLMFI